MARKKLLTLAKNLDFTTEDEYFNYIVVSYINGQRQQVKSLYNDMREADKKAFLIYLEGEAENYEILNIVLND